MWTDISIIVRHGHNNHFLNGGDIAVLGDSYSSRGLVFRGQLVEKDLIEVFVLS